MNRIVRTMVAAVAVASCAALLATNARAELPAGKPFPALTVHTTDGKTLDVSKLRGKVVLVDIWATWCPPCRMETPHLQTLHSKYAKKGLRVVGISLAEGKAKPQAFARDNHLNYTIGYTDEAGAREVAQKLQIEPIPTTYIVDKRGVIRLAEVGFDPSQTPDKLEKTIKQLLAAK